MHTALERAHFYPDGGGYYLREAIAEKFGLKRENVILGSGSNEIIEFLGHAFLRPGDEVVTSDHAFAVYTLMATAFRRQDGRGARKTGLRARPRRRARPPSRRARVRCTSPARTTPPAPLSTAAEIERFMARVPDHVIVVFDEAYHEFLHDAPDTLRYVREDRPVIILRTFSKIQGLANLRIGYGMASAETIDILQKTRQPFNANGIAQAGALASLGDHAHQERTRAVTDEGREFLQRRFAEMGVEFVPSHANFVLAQVGDGKRVFEALLKEGVIVRAMGGYKLPAWIRVSIGTMKENQRFIDALGLTLHARQA